MDFGNWEDIFYHSAKAPSGSGPLHCRGFMITLRHTTIRRTPLDEWSARRRDLYLTTHNTHKRQTSMRPAGLEPTIPASERPQTHPLDRAATGTDGRILLNGIFDKQARKVRVQCKCLRLQFIGICGTTWHIFGFHKQHKLHIRPVR